MRRPAVGDGAGRLARPLDDVVEAEAGATDVGRTHVNRERVVEAGHVAEADARFHCGCVHAGLEETLVAASELLQVRDPCDLEPDQIHGVVDDALCVRLVEADLQVGCEPISVHGGGTYRLRLVSKRSTTEEDTMRRILTIALLALVALVSAACSAGGDDDEAGGEAGEAAVTAEAEAVEGGGEAVAGDLAVAQPADRQSSLPALGPRVIRTASLGLSVPRDRFDEVVNEARTLATGFGGFVVSSTSSQGSQQRLDRGTLVVRVPDRSYDQALKAFTGLGRVESQKESGQDVSQEFVDLEARARHLEAVERQLLEFLDRAENVAAALAVQSRLADVQLELEQVRGRLRYLDDQVTFATISLAIHERGAVAAPDDGGPALSVVEAWKTAARGFLTVVGWIFVAAATIAPVVALVALAVFAARLARRKLARA